MQPSANSMLVRFTTVQRPIWPLFNFFFQKIFTFLRKFKVLNLYLHTSKLVFGPWDRSPGLWHGSDTSRRDRLWHRTSSSRWRGETTWRLRGQARSQILWRQPSLL
jgi:hypothetical protein